MSLIRLRGGTEYEWDTAGPTLRAREVGVTTDTHRLKVGDGVSAWADLPWVDAEAIPDGGTIGQLLVKMSSDDQDVAWATLPRIYEQDDEPTSPNAGDVWVDSNSTPTPPAYVSYQDTAPVSPSLGDFWVDSDSEPVTISTAVQTTAVDYTPVATSWLIVCTATLTIDLPTAAGWTGKELVIKNSGVGTVTVDGYSTELIDGSLTQILGPADAVTIVSTGTGWVIV